MIKARWLSLDKIYIILNIFYSKLYQKNIILTIYILHSGVAQCMRCDARASPKIATPKFFFA